MVLFVMAQGNPLPVLTWFREGIPINESSDERISITLVQNLEATRISSTISIEDTIPSDSGQYICIASNDAGNVTAFFDVTVNGKLKSIHK